jgi:signal transduction histidine kinase
LGNIKYSDLATDARKVLLTGESVENEAQSQNGEWFLIKILPYLSNDNLREGVVITCVNVSGQRRFSLPEVNGNLKGGLELTHLSEMLAVTNQMAAGISQEIRNPLLALKEFTSSSEDMTAELNRIEAMVNELLTLVSPSKSKVSNLDVVAMLQDVIALIEPQNLKTNEI